MLRPRPLLALMEWFIRVAHREPNAGADGEMIASLFLRRNGFRVVAKDWRYEFLPGDIDLVAWEGSTLCFAEVKTRSGEATSLAAESAVDAAKQETVRRLAGAYVQCLPWEDAEVCRLDVRFDIVSIYLRGKQRPDIQLRRHAF